MKNIDANEIDKINMISRRLCEYFRENKVSPANAVIALLSTLVGTLITIGLSKQEILKSLVVDGEQIYELLWESNRELEEDN